MKVLNRHRFEVVNSVGKCSSRYSCIWRLLKRIIKEEFRPLFSWKEVKGNMALTIAWVMTILSGGLAIPVWCICIFVDPDRDYYEALSCPHRRYHQLTSACDRKCKYLNRSRTICKEFFWSGY